MNSTISSRQKSLAFSAACLMLVGLLTGLLVAAAMTGQLPADPQAMLAAHLNGLMGCFWLLGVSWTLPMLNFKPSTSLKLVRLIELSVWANWFFTLLKAFWQVKGLDYSEDLQNNLIAASLQGFVVLPALIGSIAWTWGLKPAKEA
ncbi:MAG: hypothetical protein CVV27_10550 [Candidatus Melainabacteria bacterium HGW-Melainabacteria-1]|nr:MAG: hypothetical protein CVV27_10550 [Candidatus Melainabacteria bacterium HGW-Melainabacteria-1]